MQLESTMSLAGFFASTLCSPWRKCGNWPGRGEGIQWEDSAYEADAI